MTREELKRIIEYINSDMRKYISTRNEIVNSLIKGGYFKEYRFIKDGVVELND